MQVDWVTRMNRAMELVEANLEAGPDFEAVAREAMCSVYHFQRLFSFIAGVPLAEYIRRRRMTKAAVALQNTGIKVVDLAAQYGYESPEAFARAFHAQHGVTPTVARKMGTPLKSYPRISFHITIKGADEMEYRIEKKDAFQVYGIEEWFETKNGENFKDIPLFWDRLIESGGLGKLGESTKLDQNKPGMMPINAMCGTEPMQGTRMTYMICAMKTPECDTAGYKVVDVPASTWAIFRNKAHGIEETSAAVQELNRQVYTDWLPSADYNMLDQFDCEMYYKGDGDRYYEEIWIRVQPK